MHLVSRTSLIGLIFLGSSHSIIAQSAQQLPLNADNCAIMRALNAALPPSCNFDSGGETRGIVVRLNDQIKGNASASKTAVRTATKSSAVVQQKSGQSGSSHQKFDRSAAKNENGYFIQFAFDSDNLEPAYKEHLDRLAIVLETEAMVNSCLRIVGHTDTSGSADYNKELSHKRAVQVATYLNKTGSIDASRIALSAAGESSPLPDIHGHDPLNRRVEFATRQTKDGC